MKSPHEAEPPEQGSGSPGESKAPKKVGDLQKNITMAQIAKEAGVSQGAISSLLNDRDYGIRVSEKTRERVFKVCREMGYIPNDLRAVVRMYPEFGDFCLLLSDRASAGIAHPFFARLLSGALGAVPDPSHPLTLGTYEEGRDYLADPESLPHPVRSGVVSKFLSHGNPSSALLQTLTRRGFPVVSIGYDAPVAGVVSIVPDYARAARLAIEHLVQLGHRQIAIVSGPFGTSDWPILELNRGVRIACEELRVPLEAHHIVYGSLSPDAEPEALREMLTHKSAPTAVFCMSDGAASAVLGLAANLDIETPRRLSVIGCGDDPCARYLRRPLSSIHIPVEELGAAAVRAIERLVREPLPAEPSRIVLGVELKARESTAPRAAA
jgi:DNA-binding LacI/PurR family transcriptional regulator